MKLHLGCGSIYLRGYVNIDVVDWSGKCDLVADCRNLHMYENKSIEHIFNHALLEHIPPWDTLRALKEWYRVLKKGGTIQIEVPDLERIFEDWFVHEVLDEQIAIDYIFGGNKAKKRTYARYQHHLTGFTYARLTGMMKRVGFKGLKRIEHDEYRIVLVVRGRK